MAVVSLSLPASRYGDGESRFRLGDESVMTDAILTRKLLRLLADCYAEEPHDITTTH